MIIADVQIPAQPAPALTTVAPKKPQTPGEEQIKPKSPREASHKLFTTSEHLKPSERRSCSSNTCSNEPGPVCYLIVIGPIKPLLSSVLRALFSATDAAYNNCFCVCECERKTTAYQRMHSCLLIDVQFSAVEKQQPEQPH